MVDRITPDDPVLLASVRQGEGLRFKAYPDPDSPLGLQLAKPLMQRQPGWQNLSGAPWTIGYGHTGADVKKGDTCTKTQADAWLFADIQGAMQVLDIKEPWWRTMCAARQRVLAEMTFNLGFGRLQGFHRFWNALQASRWAEAADEMMDSLWALQVHDRATRLSNAMREG